MSTRFIRDTLRRLVHRVDLEANVVEGELFGGVAGDVSELSCRALSAVEADANGLTEGLREISEKVAVEHVAEVGVDLRLQIGRLVLIGSPTTLLDHHEEVGAICRLGDEVDRLGVIDTRHASQATSRPRS